ncbi:MAG: hypothetical protein K0U72_00615 [Gammaproteobacteria bacterium]|nr:hypothetical protein [Gammaproteobacteria bacterium]
MKVCFLTLLALLLAAMPSYGNAAESARVFDFAVKLDGDQIGYHRFEIVDDGALLRVTSEAKFDVRFLFINAYKYRHTGNELWDGGCLSEFSANTRVNSKKLNASGSRQDDRFVIAGNSQGSSGSDCVMTFAYWNPEFLKQSQLLNPQSGELLDVDIEALPAETISVRGGDVAASVFRLTAKKMDLKVWYSPDNEWLALESVAKGGRIIRYELT